MKDVGLDKSVADAKELKFLQLRADKSPFNPGNFAMQNESELRAMNDNSNDQFVEKMRCPLCQDIFRCRFQLEKHVMQIHSVNADGLKRLLVLVNQSHWLNLDNRNITDSTQLTPPLPTDKMQKQFTGEEDPNQPDKNEEPNKFLNINKNLFSSPENQASKDFNLMSVPNSTISEKHVYKYRCGKCSLAFQTLNKLELHSQYHVFRDARKCILCGRSFRSVNALSRHLENMHSNMNDQKILFEQKYEAAKKEIAQKSNLSAEVFAQQLFEDRRASSNSNVQQNNKLNSQKINSLEDFVNSDHIAQTNYNELIRKYKCQDCRVAYTRQKYLILHNKFHSQQKNKNITFTDNKLLEVTKSFKCDTCRENFTEKNILFVHYKSINHCFNMKLASEKSKSDNVSKQLLLGEGFTNQNSKSFDQKPFKCYICKICYSNVDTLELHKQSSFHSFQVLKLQNLHNSNALKNKSFADLFFAEDNKNIHSKEKDPEKTIACSKCNKCFTNSKQLIFHQPLCSIIDPMALIQKIISPDDASRCDIQNLQSSLSYTQFLEKYSQQFGYQDEQKDVSMPPKQKTSHIYKHLLESFGFDLVMQFNESHQKRTREDQELSFKNKLLTPKEEYNIFAAKEVFCSEQHEKDANSEGKSSICQICNKEFSSVLVLKAHSEEVHNDLVPQEILEKYIQDFKKEYERKVVVVTAATSSSTLSTPSNSKSSDEKLSGFQNSKQRDHKVTHFNKEAETPSLPVLNPSLLSLSSSLFPTDFSQAKTIQNKLSQEGQDENLSKMQIAALNVLAASRLQQQIQGYPGFMVNMMGLPTNQNLSTVAAMNIQPPLFSSILSTQTEEPNISSFPAVPAQTQMLTNNLNALQPQQTNVSHFFII